MQVNPSFQNNYYIMMIILEVPTAYDDEKYLVRAIYT